MENEIHNRLTLAVLLARKTPRLSPSQVAADVRGLASVGRMANNHATRLCNGNITQEAYDRSTEKLRERAQTLLGEYGLAFKIGGDPRGYCFKILGLPGNTWGGESEGFGID